MNGFRATYFIFASKIIVCRLKFQISFQNYIFKTKKLQEFSLKSTRRLLHSILQDDWASSLQNLLLHLYEKLKFNQPYYGRDLGWKVNWTVSVICYRSRLLQCYSCIFNFVFMWKPPVSHQLFWKPNSHQTGP